MLYVQHLLGVGHLFRSARIAAAAARGGFAVVLVTGGVLPGGIDFGEADIIALPPVQAGRAGFSDLVGADGLPFGPAAKQARAALLLAAHDRIDPDVLMIEAFPFGRRQMRFELLPLLDHARSRRRPPLMAVSVRDILQRGRAAERIEETVDIVQSFFDLVLVHGDPGFAAFADSFPAAPRFAEKVVYTGIVASRPPIPHAGGREGVVVSAGGGAVGAPLIRAACEARLLTRSGDRPWLVLTGPNMPPAALDGLRHPGITVQASVPDLAAVLARADLSISQAGYNTVADVLVAGCRSILVPYSHAGETEQGDRAARLSRLELATVIGEADLDPRALATAIDDALGRAPGRHRLAIRGAEVTARVLRERLGRRTREASSPLTT